MKPAYIASLFLALVATGLLAVCIGSGSGSPARAASGDWPMYGHDPSRTNFNPDETTINSSNLNQLVSRWQANIGSDLNNPASSAPSVAGGAVYVGSSARSGPNFFAYSAQNGTPYWSVNLSYTNACWNVGIGSTPAISGTVVAVGGGDTAYYG